MCSSSRHSHLAVLRLLSIVASFVALASARADVIVLSNRTGRELPIRFTPVNGAAQQLTLAVDDNMPLYCDGKANVAFTSPGGSQNVLVDANCAYFIGRANDGRVELHKIGLGEDGTLLAGRTLPGVAARPPLAIIPVKILVDEEEPARASLWDQRLRRRIEAASAVFEKYFNTKLQVVATGTWNSDNNITDFNEALSEFEREANPAPAKLAIGFTSQWRAQRGRMHMAGTRGPLHAHILVREGNPELNESERLEFLIHEIGHYFGAAHSPESVSVMRPVLGDKQAGRVNFRIHFDPVNTLAMAIISEEMRRRNLNSIGELAPDTRKRLTQIYTELAHSLPDDPAAPSYAQLMRSESGSPVVTATRQVLRQITKSLAENRMLPLQANASPLTGGIAKTRKQGDALTEYLVREAARAAATQPDEVRTQAFLLAIAIGLNDIELVAQQPNAANTLRAIEAPSERAMRMAMMGDVTMRGRRDLARHFLVSGLLVVGSNAQAAQSIGLAKEFADAQTPSGFSFADIAADRAGARFGQAVLEKRVTLAAIVLAFSVPAFMPEVNSLPEKLTAKELAAQFGGKDDPRFAKLVQDIDNRIAKLSGYRPIGANTGTP